MAAARLAPLSQQSLRAPAQRCSADGSDGCAVLLASQPASQAAGASQPASQPASHPASHPASQLDLPSSAECGLFGMAEERPPASNKRRPRLSPIPAQVDHPPANLVIPMGR